MKKILVIEDEYNLRSDISEILENEGYSVVQAEDGKRGYEKIFEDSPDIILCDIMMPKMSGLEILTRIKAKKTHSLIPFLFITALSDRKDIRKGMELGADDYLTKPFTKDELLKSVTARLGKSDVISKSSEEVLNKLRKNIVSYIPHELLTPLNGILGFGELLKEGAGTMSRDEIMTYGSNIVASAKRLQSLIKKYLIYIRLESSTGSRAGENNLLDPSIFIDKTAKEIAFMNKRTDDVELTLEECEIDCRADEFELIAAEIIENAFKFSGQGTKIKINCAVEGGNMVFSVKNRGREFPDEYIEKIGAFMQFDRDKFEQQGSGLGLAIVQRILNLYGGKMLIYKNGSWTVVSIYIKLK